MIFRKECIVEPSEFVEIDRLSANGSYTYRISINAGWPDENVTIIDKQSMKELRDALNKEFPVVEDRDALNKEFPVVEDRELCSKALWKLGAPRILDEMELGSRKPVTLKFLKKLFR